MSSPSSRRCDGRFSAPATLVAHCDRKATAAAHRLTLIVVALHLPMGASHGQQTASSLDARLAQRGSDAPRRPELKTYMGRTIAPTMGYGGADWLIRASRETEEEPAKLLNSLGLKAGQTVCDFGCGNGYHTLQLARRVGPRGVVYAIDIQAEMLQKLGERAQPRGLNNIKTVLATQRDPGLPRAQIELMLMVDVYHELSDPEPALAQAHQALTAQGRIAVVEFRKEDPTVPIRELHKMTQQQVLKEFSANRFKLVGQFDGLPWQHVLFFARDDSPRAQVDLVPWSKP